MKLTRDERAALFHREVPRITREAKPCDPGIVITLSPKLSIEVTAVIRTKAKLWRVDYAIRDDRPHLLRRVPTTDRPRKDSRGKVIRPDTAFARIDSSYTTTSHLAVPDAGEAVDDATLERLTHEARDRGAHRKIEEKGSLLAAMDNLRAAIDALPSETKRSTSRTMWTLRSRLDSAERELRRRAAA